MKTEIEIHIGKFYRLGYPSYEPERIDQTRRRTPKTFITMLTPNTPVTTDSGTVPPLSESPCSAPFREYCAMQFYRMEHARNGTAGVRWWCLCEDLREKYLAMADQVVATWTAEENAAKQRSEDTGAATARQQPNEVATG